MEETARLHTAQAALEYRMTTASKSISSIKKELIQKLSSSKIAPTSSKVSPDQSVALEVVVVTHVVTKSERAALARRARSAAATHKFPQLKL